MNFFQPHGSQLVWTIQLSFSAVDFTSSSAYLFLIYLTFYFIITSLKQSYSWTRKSSCGKPQEAYRPRHNLSKHILSREGGGGTYLGRGYLPWGSPHPDIGRGVPTLDLPWGTSHSDLAEEVPTLDGGRGTYLGVPPILTWLRRYLPWMGGGVPTLGYHPSGVDRQTPVKTVPSRRTRYASGN